MSTVGSVSSYYSLVSSGSTSASTSTASSNASTAYTTFLKLLTTELQNQNPLNPTDTSQFTGQLISLAGIEQQEQTNSTLGTILTDLTALSTTSGLGYVGKTVEATGSTSPMQSDSVAWNYTLDSTASKVTLTVTDSDGNTVDTTSGSTSSGSHAFTWDGKGTNGSTYTSGDYTLTITAEDSSGNAVSTSTSIVGKVTGVDSSSGTTELEMGDISVAVGKVTSIKS